MNKDDLHSLPASVRRIVDEVAQSLEPSAVQPEPVQDLEGASVFVASLGLDRTEVDSVATAMGNAKTRHVVARSEAHLLEIFVARPCRAVVVGRGANDRFVSDLAAIARSHQRVVVVSGGPIVEAEVVVQIEGHDLVPNLADLLEEAASLAQMAEMNRLENLLAH